MRVFSAVAGGGFLQAGVFLATALGAQLLLTRQGVRALRSALAAPHAPPSAPPRWSADGDFSREHHAHEPQTFSDAPPQRHHPWEEDEAPPLPPPPARPPRLPPPLPSPPAPQPDEVRRRSEEAGLTAMRCGERIPPESILTTNDGARSVTVFARAFYKGPTDEGLHAWGYRVEFTNRGEGSVQLLTRHWVIVDADGKAEEVKGPGAKGQMPTLQPGEKWEYESGTRIATDRGSMHGWFTMEDLHGGGGDSGGGGGLFPVRVGRLALSPDGNTADVPCIPPTDVSVGKLPATSVHSTERVIVGAVSLAA